jgi:hypothetical protein
MAKKKLTKKNKTLLLTIGAAAVGVGFILAKAFKKKDESNLAGVGAVDIQHYSPYKTQVMLLIPERGKATSRDLSLLVKDFNIHGMGRDMIGRYFPNKELAIDMLAKLANRDNGLYKPYKVYIITDKQFSMLPEPTAEGALSVMTTKQKEDAITIN